MDSASRRADGGWPEKGFRPERRLASLSRTGEEGSSEVDIDGLDLREELHGVAPLLVRPHPGGLDAAEGEVDLAAQRRLVDVRDADVHPVGEAEGQAQVPGVDRG